MLRTVTFARFRGLVTRERFGAHASGRLWTRVLDARRRARAKTYSAMTHGAWRLLARAGRLLWRLVAAQLRVAVALMNAGQ